eukprot:12683959-Alexandrium_andersonii.AAC.1
MAPESSGRHTTRRVGLWRALRRSRSWGARAARLLARRAADGGAPATASAGDAGRRLRLRPAATPAARTLGRRPGE